MVIPTVLSVGDAENWSLTFCSTNDTGEMPSLLASHPSVAAPSSGTRLCVTVGFPPPATAKSVSPPHLAISFSIFSPQSPVVLTLSSIGVAPLHLSCGPSILPQAPPLATNAVLRMVFCEVFSIGTRRKLVCCSLQREGTQKCKGENDIFQSFCYLFCSCKVTKHRSFLCYINEQLN